MITTFNMVLVVLPALIPEIPRIYEIYFEAFKNERMGQIILDVLFPGTRDEAFRKAHAAGTLAYWHTTTNQYTLKCIDTASGDIVGMGLGDLYLTERSEEERANHGIPWLEGEQRQRAEAILNPLWEMREKLFGGRRYICKFIHSPLSLSPHTHTCISPSSLCRLIKTNTCVVPRLPCRCR